MLLCRLQVLLEFVDLSTGNIFVHGSERGRAEVLTFFFTELPEAQVVLATSTGLELCSFVSKRQVRLWLHMHAVSRAVRLCFVSACVLMLMIYTQMHLMTSLCVCVCGGGEAKIPTCSILTRLMRLARPLGCNL